MNRGRQREPQLRKWNPTPLPAFFPLQLGMVQPSLSSLPTKDGWLQETRKETEGPRQNPGRGRELLSLWSSEAGSGVDGEFRGLSGRGGYHLLSCPSSPLQMRQCRAREEKWLAQGLRASKWQRESHSPHLCLLSTHSLHGITAVFQLWYPCLFVTF